MTEDPILAAARELAVQLACVAFDAPDPNVLKYTKAEAADRMTRALHAFALRQRAQQAWETLPILEQPNWMRCPSTHCERRQECASPNECSGTGRGKVWLLATHLEARAKEIEG